MADTSAGPPLAHTSCPPARQDAADLPTPREAAPAPRLRTVFRFTDWTLSQAADEPDMPPALHQFRCRAEDEDGTVCGAEGPELQSFNLAQSWPFVHVKEDPEHRSYEHLARVPWTIGPKVEPGTVIS
ncbi:hypothetical protein [Kitasatospora sp. NPDC088779]|uniref:DUF7848 domain-containing protein n=1 Tax=Kitasatospora sp. NPDC088779 TaxID=3154964 RepID=UPI003415EBF3